MQKRFWIEIRKPTTNQFGEKKDWVCTRSFLSEEGLETWLKREGHDRKHLHYIPVA